MCVSFICSVIILNSWVVVVVVVVLDLFGDHSIMNISTINASNVFLS